MIMELKIEFGIDFELKRVSYALKKLEWYDSKGYHPKLPEGINKQSSEKEIKNQIIKEFEEKKFKEVANQISSDFSTIKEKLSKKLNEILNKNVPETFFVYLTDYGTDGSYTFPNIVIFNINNKKGFKTIVHEIIHLLIENYIQKYKIQHEEKERIVDLILNSEEFSFLEYNFWQDSYNGVEKYIDELFNMHFFKDSERFFSKIEDARASISRP